MKRMYTRSQKLLTYDRPSDTRPKVQPFGQQVSYFFRFLQIPKRTFRFKVLLSSSKRVFNIPGLLC
jgi:hypothetical protein